MFDFLNTKKMKKRFEDIPEPLGEPTIKDIPVLSAVHKHKEDKSSNVSLLKKIFSKEIKYVPPVLSHGMILLSNHPFIISEPTLFFVQGKYFFRSGIVARKCCNRIFSLDKFVSKPILDIMVHDKNFDDIVFTFCLASAKPVCEYKDLLGYVSFSVYTIYNGKKIYAEVSLIDSECDFIKNMKNEEWAPMKLPQYHRVTDSEIITISKAEFYASKAMPFDKNIVIFDIHDMQPYFDNNSFYWLGREVSLLKDGSKFYKPAKCADIITEDGVVWGRVGRVRIVNSVSGPVAYIEYRTPYKTVFGAKSFKTMRKSVPVITVGAGYYPEYSQDPQNNEEKAHRLVSLTYHKKDDKNV